MRKVAVSLADSVDLRIILSVLYIITEVIRNEKVAGSSDFNEIAETFSNELSKCLENQYGCIISRDSITYLLI